MTSWVKETFTQEQIRAFAENWHCTLDEAEERLMTCIVDQSC